MRITWGELAVDFSDQSSDNLLAEWRWLVPSSYSLHMVSALGDAFLSDTGGQIFWLDVGSAELTAIAETKDAFDQLRQQPDCACRWFVPLLVGDLLASGKSLAIGQCFSYKIPPTLGGAFEPPNFDACDLSVHFHTLGQLQKQVRPLPVGTAITSVKPA
jgi:hypothetical protein